MTTNNEPTWISYTRKIFDEFLNHKGPNHPNRQQVAQLISERKRGVSAGISKMLNHLHMAGYKIDIHINEPHENTTT